MKILLVAWLSTLLPVLRGMDGPWTTWNYCGKDVKCKDNGVEHTVCERKHECGPIDGCSEIMTDEYRDLMVKLHNEKRNYVALGKHAKHSNVKPASNMRAMSYDFALEYTIRCHINRCTGTEHDVCRGTKKWVQVSQNLCGYTEWDANKSPEENIIWLGTWCVDMWFNESYYDGVDFGTVVEKYDTLMAPDGGKTGHFTAMVWGITAFLGCHFSRDLVEKDHDEMGGGKGSNRGIYSFVGCNYGIGGNNEDRPMYQVGKACTRCPRGIKCNEEYPGLCGEIRYATDISGRSAVAFNPLGTSAIVAVVVVVILVVLIIAGVLIYKFYFSDNY